MAPRWTYHFRNSVTLFSRKISSYSRSTYPNKFDNILFAHNENVGSIYMERLSNVIMSESRFYNNTIVTQERVGLLQLAGRSVLRASSCTFDSNYFLKSSTLLHVSNSAQSSISDSEFSNNTAVQGGGVGTNKRGSLNFINCALTNNKVTQNGGVVKSDGGHTGFKSCHISSNSAVNGGVVSTSEGSVVFKGSIIDNNSASDTGGVVEAKASLAFSNCTLTSNSASRDAGVISVTYHGNLQIENSEFGYNWCDHDGGAIRAFRNITINLHNCHFTGNRAFKSNGGAISLQTESQLTSHSCTFDGNAAAEREAEQSM